MASFSPGLARPQPSAWSCRGIYRSISDEPYRMRMQFNRERSVVDFIRENSHARPNALAVKEGGQCWTYGELDVKSDLVAQNLQRRGLQMEEPVAVLLPASSDYVMCMLGRSEERRVGEEGGSR